MSSFRSLAAMITNLYKQSENPGRYIWKHFKEKGILIKSLLSKKKAFLMSEKRMSFFFFSAFPKMKASMAVEATLVLPLFFFFFLHLLFVFDTLRLHGNLMAALHQTGNQMAFYGYTYRQLESGLEKVPDGISSLALSEGYARSAVIDYLGKDYLDATCLVAGTGGLHFIKSSVMKEDEIIDLCASYRVAPLIRLFSRMGFSMENRYYGRAWTGYAVEGKEGASSQEEAVVYIAENGTVYHLLRSCAYLNPSIEAVSSAVVSNLRNEGGERYVSCGRCTTHSYQAVAYITAYGNRIHGSLDCGGLRRTIYTIKLSEAAGKDRCSKCG